MAFKTSYRAEFNCMVGMVVNKPPTLDDFAFPGSSTVEVLGGNHSRVALQELNLQQCVTMVLYENLSDAQALTIGLEHNRTNENAKLMNFEDDVLLFRNVLESKRKENSEKTKRQISIIWRSDLCGITQRNKVELRNSYKIHMHLASLQKDEWNALINVFDAFRKKTIKGLKKVDNVTQYMFRMFIRLPSDSVKRNLLLELGSGEITPHEFRMKIKRIVDQKQIDLAETEDIAKDNEMELSTEDSLSANDQRYTEEEAYNFVDIQQEQTSHRTKMDNHEQLEEDMKYITDSLKREKELRKMAFVTIEAKETLIKEKDKKILELEDRDKLQQKTNKEYMIKQNLELEKYKLQIRQLTMKTDLLQKELEREKIRCKAAEETAARARAQFLKNTNVSLFLCYLCYNYIPRHF
ncbi:uncharacterized protein LOC132745896 [Ruditapes philippinarum]|uniref:uncharacterized protein LOC132745896 n=1 Tax=Ruditapes philippinarum TaxID=129788 RepID=UPI00295C12AB|nr:uncharacterized protein LOC132745896 [Ruditapes philippinarum]